MSVFALPGAIPFLALTPVMVNAAGFSQFVDVLAGVQVEYGALVVSFLGAVHWGLAMSGTLSEFAERYGTNFASFSSVFANLEKACLSLQRCCHALLDARMLILDTSLIDEVVQIMYIYSLSTETSRTKLQFSN